MTNFPLCGKDFQLMEYKAIFQPLQVGPLLWRNRIEVAPAAPFLPWRAEDGTMPLKAYYAALAKSGAAVLHIGIGSLEDLPGKPGVIRPACAEMKLEELPELVSVLHSDGCLAGVELSVSRYMMGPRERITTMPESEILSIIDSYVLQAKRAKEAGFDILLIHGGHGNVPAQFFSAQINRRTDRWGGSEENRSRFALELLDALRAAVGDGMAIEYRISAEECMPGATCFPETLRFAERIQDKIDLLHVSRGLLEEDETLPIINSPVYMPRGSNIPFAKEFRAKLRIPVSVVCGMDLDTAETAVAEGSVDAAAMIRTALADTDFVRKAQEGNASKIRPCVRCNGCIDSTHTKRTSVRCAVNPLCGRESVFDPDQPAKKCKDVVVIGGGPAGLEAARTAARRGHSVTLLEKNKKLGGTLHMAAAADFKEDMRRYLDWSIRDVGYNEDIVISLGSEVTPKRIADMRPDAVIVAVGAKPIIPKIATCPEKAIWVGELETNPQLAGENVVIAGAGFTGLEMALSLAEAGKKVTVIDMIPEERVGADGIAISMTWLKNRLRELNVGLACERRLEDVTELGAVVSLKNGEKETIPCDTVVLSLGVRPDRSLFEALQGLAPEVIAVGDCSAAGGTLMKAVAGGFEAAMSL